MLLGYSVQLSYTAYVNIISSFIPRLNKLLFDPKGNGLILYCIKVYVCVHAKPTYQHILRKNLN